ncbi:hypothetical protein MMC22_006843 [Lobaria immixta]|nr:hypothetical protein [Lobaria immixta]
MVDLIGIKIGLIAESVRNVITIRPHKTHDVTLLPRLWIAYSASLTPDWRTEVAEKTVNCLLESQGADYIQNESGKTWGPWPTEIEGLDNDNQTVITSQPNNRPRIIPYGKIPVPGEITTWRGW